MSELILLLKKTSKCFCEAPVFQIFAKLLRPKYAEELKRKKNHNSVMTALHSICVNDL